MKIYISHSKDFDYKKELYLPIRKSDLYKNNRITLPHENSNESFNSKEFIKNSCDLIIAEVSIPATGVGIELGWADAFNIPILCIYKKDIKYPGSINTITKNIIDYEDSIDMINKIQKFIDSF